MKHQGLKVMRALPMADDTASVLMPASHCSQGGTQVLAVYGEISKHQGSSMVPELAHGTFISCSIQLTDLFFRFLV
jgi:hypothetical protein